MIEFFQNMQPFELTLWWIALITTFIFVIQFIMSFVGFDGHDHDIGVGTDFSSDPDFETDNAQHDVGPSFQFFTIKNGISFLMFFAWGTLQAMTWGISNALAIVVGAGFSAMMTLTMAGLYFLMKKLQTNNVPTMESLVGKTATVYLRIPAGGQGKITVSLNGSHQTLDATSEDNLKTGEMCEVVGLYDNQIPIVKRKAFTAE